MKFFIGNMLWAILGRHNFARFTRFLNNWARQDVPNDILTNGERLIQRVVLQRFRPTEEKMILDIGANRGDWTKALIENYEMSDCSGLNLYAFEPGEEAFKELTAWIKNRNVENIARPLNCGVSNASGEKEFNIISEKGFRNSVYKHKDLKYQQQVKVKFTSLDDFCNERNIHYIDLIKIDTEGHEMEILDGALKMLSSQAIGAVQFEYNYCWITARKYLKDAFTMLVPMGYVLGKVTPKGLEVYKDWDVELETFREGNYLACLKPLVCNFPILDWWKEIS